MSVRVRCAKDFVITRLWVLFSFSEAKTFTAGGDDRIGRKYKKVVYREYTDAQFKKQKRTAADKHLGVLGPILRAEVGDTMEVVFKNTASSGMKFSMHPHGLYYRYKAMCFLSYFLDDVFLISGIIKVEVSVISRSRRLRLITLTETLII